MEMRFVFVIILNVLLYLNTIPEAVKSTFVGQSGSLNLTLSLKL